MFEDAQALVKAGQYAQACPKFEAAAKLYPGAGVLLNLGDCYEKTGRFASAWAQFGASESAAQRANRHDQAEEARRRQAAVAPRVTKLTVVVAHPVDGLTVSRDGAELEAPVWGTAIPIDAGAHMLRAQAPGYQTWTTSVTVPSSSQALSVEVPALAAVPAAVTTPAPSSTASAELVAPSSATPAVPEAEAPQERPRSRTVPVALMATGAVLGVGGAVLMTVEALRAHSARTSDTVANTYASRAEFDSTKTPYYIGVGLAAAGGVVLAAGAIWLATPHRPHTAPTGVRVTPWVSASSSGCAIGGSW